LNSVSEVTLRGGGPREWALRRRISDRAGSDSGALSAMMCDRVYNGRLRAGLIKGLLPLRAAHALVTPQFLAALSLATLPSAAP